jgi:hypothetical protein
MISTVKSLAKAHLQDSIHALDALDKLADCLGIFSDLKLSVFIEAQLEEVNERME